MRSPARRLAARFLLPVVLVLLPLVVALAQTPVPVPAVPESVRPPAKAVTGDPEPDMVTVVPQPAVTDLWRQIRRGVEGKVSIPDPLAGVLIQSEGELWRTLRNGPYRIYSALFLLAVVIALAVFFVLRGRIRLREGRSGVRIRRFGFFERFSHWVTATSFILLGLTGLNMLYGREVLMPLLGRSGFATLTLYGKITHNYVAFAFMAGLTLLFLQWVWFNLPNRHDIVWLLKGGGLFGGHAPSKKFNAGQKLMFWIVILGGLSLSLSGLQLLFPYQLHFFQGTFRFLESWLALGLPTELTALQEQQLAAVWHGLSGIVMIGVILGHIYIGTLGMEGAVEAMWQGEVDLNWAREHHDLWVEELTRKGVVPQAAE